MLPELGRAPASHPRLRPRPAAGAGRSGRITARIPSCGAATSWRRGATASRPTPVEVAGRTIDLGPQLPSTARPSTARSTCVRGGSSGPGSSSSTAAVDGWPWRYEVRERVTVTGADRPGRARRSANLDERPMPAGIGIHPWFLGPPDVAIRGDVVFAPNDDTPALPGARQRADRPAPPGRDGRGGRRDLGRAWSPEGGGRAQRHPSSCPGRSSTSGPRCASRRRPSSSSLPACQASAPSPSSPRPMRRRGSGACSAANRAGCRMLAPGERLELAMELAFDAADPPGSDPRAADPSAGRHASPAPTRDDASVPSPRLPRTPVPDAPDEASARAPGRPDDPGLAAGSRRILPRRGWIGLVLARIGDDRILVAAAWLTILIATTAMMASAIRSDAVARSGHPAGARGRAGTRRRHRGGRRSACGQGRGDRRHRPAWSSPEPSGRAGGTTWASATSDGYRLAGRGDRDRSSSASPRALAEHGRLVAGDWPPAQAGGDGVVVAAISAAAAGQLGLQLGSQLTVRGQRRRTASRSPVRIGGVYEPVDATEPYWWSRRAGAGGPDHGARLHDARAADGRSFAASSVG